MQPVKTPHAEVIRGYRLLQPLPATGPGELWQASAPGGGLKAVRFLPGSARDRIALERLRAVAHPALLALDRVEFRHDELMIIRDLAPHTLETLLAEYRGNGRPGLPRSEALAYLREVAEALDLMAQQFGLQHLALCPRAIALAEQGACVVDFGLANCLAQRPGGPVEARELGAFAPPHAAPELGRGKISPACDQYSLAVTYLELLTGLPPGDDQDLSALPAKDRTATARALDPDPAKRFASCGDYIQAMMSAATKDVRRPPARPRRSELPPAAANGSALPGYRLLECSGRNSLGEVWKAETLTGSPRLVRFLFGAHVPERRGEEGPLARLQALDDDALAPTTFLPDNANRLAVVSDPGKLSLAGRHRRCQADALPGIPRYELLDYLRLIAKGLDELKASCGLQHLSLTPRQIYVGNGPPRMVDFGLAETFWLPSGQQAEALDARYAPPELLQGQVTTAADQYSLAVLLHELLTGCHPFRTLSAQELLSGRRPPPELTMLSSSDQLAVARALHLDPERRFSTCADFVAALEDIAPPGRAVAPALPARILTPPQAKTRLLPTAGKLTPAQVVSELVQAATGSVELRELRGVRFVLRRGKCIKHRCFARLLPGTAMLKLDGFRQRWQATATALEADHFHLFVPAAASWWENLMGRAPGLEVHIRLQRPQPAAAALTELAIDIFPVDSHADRGSRLLEELGPQLLESLRHFMQAHKDRRSQERLPFAQCVQVCPVFPNLARGEPIQAQTRDISLHGMGLILARDVGTAQVAIRLAPTQGSDLITVPGRIVHASPLGDGQVDIGINFAMPTPW